MAPDGVDLVHEDDAGAVLLGLLEEVAHARGADADEHLDEIGARDREKRHARLARDRTREQRLAGARRSVKQNARRDASAERLELLRVLEEVLDLVKLLDRLLDAGDVTEGDLRRVGGEPLGSRLAERHHLAAATLEVVHDQEPEAEEDEERQDVDEDRRPRARARRVLVVERVPCPVAGVDGLDRRDDLVDLLVADKSDRVALAAVGREIDVVRGRLDRERLDLAGWQPLLGQRLVGRRRCARTGRDQARHEERQHDDQHDREERSSENAVHRGLRLEYWSKGADAKALKRTMVFSPVR